MQDRDEVESTMNGQPFKAGRHAATLRRLLWREHLGLLTPDLATLADQLDAEAEAVEVAGASA